METKVYRVLVRRGATGYVAIGVDLQIASQGETMHQAVCRWAHVLAESPDASAQRSRAESELYAYAVPYAFPFAHLPPPPAGAYPPGELDVRLLKTGEELTRELRAAIGGNPEAKYDELVALADPLWDGTDAAHPAYWRGYHAGLAFAKAQHEIEQPQTWIENRGLVNPGLTIVARPDCPECDGTDAAHPAYWRGSDAAFHAMSKQLRDALDPAEPLEWSALLDLVRRLASERR